MYSPPKYRSPNYNCPHCGVYSFQTWSREIIVSYTRKNASGTNIQENYKLGKFDVSRCFCCGKDQIWKIWYEKTLSSTAGKLIYPTTGTVELPNADLPQEIKEDYLEAREILNVSPRGAAAILRLAIQKLCIHLGEPGKSINADIKSLVKKGLPKKIQQAFDIVRVTGNNSVHPGELDMKDNVEITSKLFGLINTIVAVLITEPKRIDEQFEEILSEKNKKNIQKRDA